MGDGTAFRKTCTAVGILTFATALYAAEWAIHPLVTKVKQGKDERVLPPRCWKCAERLNGEKIADQKENNQQLKYSMAALVVSIIVIIQCALSLSIHKIVSQQYRVV
jgi:hypothetical protein